VVETDRLTPIFLRRSGKEALSPAPPPLRTGRASFRRIRLKHEQRTLRHAANLLGWEGHLHGTRTEPAPEVLRWWQPHRQGPLRPRRQFCFAAQRRLAVVSRASTPGGSLLPFGRGDVVGPLNPYPADYRPALACSLLLYPLPCQVALRLPFRWGSAPEDNGLTTFRGWNERLLHGQAAPTPPKADEPPAASEIPASESPQQRRQERIGRPRPPPKAR
jgi:hypothetical protein